MSIGRTGLVANIRSFARHNRAFIAVLLVFLMAVPVAYSFRSGQSYLLDALRSAPGSGSKASGPAGSFGA